MEAGPEEIDDYESLPETSTVGAHMAAGAMAGIMEHCVMYPLDCVKTRMQCLCPNPEASYKGVSDALYRIVKFEGVRSTVRGVGAVVGGAGPAHAMYFACYEKLKKELNKVSPSTHISSGVAGAAATLLHDAVMNPAEVVKQRMQVFGSPYRSSLECARVVYRAEGASAFYRSYTTQLTMNIPFQAIHFVMYEAMQDWLNPRRQLDPMSHCISGGIAGAAAATITTPLDVCKTLLNTQEQCVETCKLVPESDRTASGRLTIRGFAHAVRTVYEVQGITGYMKGLRARVLFQMPATAISWSVYEFFKHTFLMRQMEPRSSAGDPLSPVTVVASLGSLPPVPQDVSADEGGAAGS